MAYGNVALIVEDDPLVRRALVRELCSIGFICESAGSLHEAQFLCGPWKLAIIDLDLPDGSGLSLAETAIDRDLCRIRIFFSATRDAHVIARAAELGDFVSKAEGIGVVVGRVQARLEAAMGRSHFSEAPISGARTVARSSNFDEPAPPLQASK